MVDEHGIAAHARKNVADEGRVEHDPRLVEEVARVVRPMLESDDDIHWALEYGALIPMASLERLATAALDAIARFEREEG